MLSAFTKVLNESSSSGKCIILTALSGLGSQPALPWCHKFLGTKYKETGLNDNSFIAQTYFFISWNGYSLHEAVLFEELIPWRNDLHDWTPRLKSACPRL